MPISEARRKWYRDNDLPLPGRPKNPHGLTGQLVKIGFGPGLPRESAEYRYLMTLTEVGRGQLIREAIARFGGDPRWPRREHR